MYGYVMIETITVDRNFFVFKIFGLIRTRSTKYAVLSKKWIVILFTTSFVVDSSLID